MIHTAFNACQSTFILHFTSQAANNSTTIVHKVSTTQLLHFVTVVTVCFR